MVQFFETVMGRAFFQGQLPALIKALARIADALERPVTAPREKLRELVSKMLELEAQIEGPIKDTPEYKEIEGQIDDLIDEANYNLRCFLREVIERGGLSREKATKLADRLSWEAEIFDLLK